MTGKYTSPCYIILPPIHDRLHQRQEPFCVDRKTYAKLSTFVKYVIKFVCRANPITNFEFAEEYVKKNKRNTYLIFIFLPYPIPNLDYVSHTRFNCVVIAKPFRYLNYEEDYVSTAYLTTYLDFVVAMCNILLDGNGQLWVVDWNCAGFCPTWFKYLGM